MFKIFSKKKQKKKKSIMMWKLVKSTYVVLTDKICFEKVAALLSHSKVVTFWVSFVTC